MKNPIRIYNRFLDLKVEIDTYQSLQFGRDYHGIADFELHVNRYMHEAKQIFKGDIIGLNKQDNKVGIILTKEIALDESGKESENFKLTGTTLDGLMSRRLTVPPSSTAYDRKSGDAETVMKHYVNNHFVNPANSRRKMPHLEIAPNYNRGAHLEWESRFKNVAEELENISIKSGLGWGIFADFKTKKLIFDVIEAKDLTQDNPFGNSPVFFSPEFETIKSQSYIDSDNELKTVGYVGGQGEGTERKIVTIGNNAGWDRIETFVDARDVGNSENDEEELTPEEIEQELIERGVEKMSEMETLRSLEAEILTPVRKISPFQYEKDFDLGDNVQVVNKSWGLQMIAPITQFKEIHETGGFRLEATFGRSRPTLISKIKNKFDELDGIEKQELPAQIAVDTKKYTDRELSKEEQERIQQSKDNLETSKQYTEDYAEKKHVESPTEPLDTDVIWVDTSDPENVIWKVWRGGIWKAGPGGPQGLPGEPGADGTPRYTWLKYADSPTSGMSDSPASKEYIGLAYNKLSPTESTKYADYAWSKVVGPKGAKGSQGVEGPAGSDGQPTYTWIKYADTVTGSGFSDAPANKEYIGLGYNKTVQAESSNPEDYTWAKIKGDKGDKGIKGAKGETGEKGQAGPQGIQGDRGKQGLRGLQGADGEQGIRGATGADGLTAYTHIAYADNNVGGGFSQSPTNKEYIGIYVDHTATDSGTPSKYAWSLIKGADGARGIQGPVGDDGRTPYFHTAYANNSSGTSGFSTTVATNKAYIGTYTNYVSNDSTNPIDYKWAKIKGEQGDKGDTGSTGPQGPKGDTGVRGLQGIQGPEGDQGIRGVTGADGRTAYTHIAYATNSTGTSGFSTSNSAGKTYIGMYVDFNSMDSGTPSKYAWSLIKGADGSQGIVGPKGSDGNTSYLHIAYANNSNGTIGFSVSDSSGKTFIGQYTDFSSADSGNPSKYNWSEIKGDKGNTGATGDKGDTGNRGPTGPQGPNIVDTNTSFGVNWLVADYIKSLNGLNVGNGQFVVDDGGNVKFAGNLEGASGRFGNVTVVNGDFTLEDSATGLQYSATPERNLIQDHSFELVKPDMNSFNQDTVNYNWVEMLTSNITSENFWDKYGAPKVSIQWNPADSDSLAIFGNQGMAVRNADFVRQSIGEGIGGGGTYTISSFFKRQWNVNPGGTPFFQIDQVANDINGDITRTRLVDRTFPSVNDDYTVTRYSDTFTVPSNFQAGDYLDIKISGGNTEWIHCDGVQLVEGNVPTVYAPEDSIWQVTKGAYKTNTDLYTLWVGAQFVNASQTITPLKKLTDCMNGWILAWSDYSGGAGDFNWVYSHIPKAHIRGVHGGEGVLVPTPAANNTTSPAKYIYVSDTHITGHDTNQDAPLNNVALREIYEY